MLANAHTHTPERERIIVHNGQTTKNYNQKIKNKTKKKFQKNYSMNFIHSRIYISDTQSSFNILIYIFCFQNTNCRLIHLFFSQCQIQILVRTHTNRKMMQKKGVKLFLTQ